MVEQPHLSPEVYARAERLLEGNVGKLVFNATLEPHWLPDGSFWYRRESREGSAFVRVDPASRRADAAFDHEGLARSLASQGHPCTATTLPFARIAAGEPRLTAVASSLPGSNGNSTARAAGLSVLSSSPRPTRSARRTADGICCAWITTRLAGCRERHDAPADRGRHGRLRLCRLARHRFAIRDPAGPGAWRARRWPCGRRTAGA